MSVERAVCDHYATGELADRVVAALRSQGVDPERATVGDLKAGDEFHTGGALATEALLDQLEMGPETRVLDIGCGIGGPARLIADRFGAHVTGVDLTPEFVEAAVRLTGMVGLSAKTDFHVGSALDLPVADAAFDLALMFHVGMNVADKPRLFAEARRALAPGGVFALFDVMRGPDPSDLLFPLPWASEPGFSFVEAPEAYEAAALAAGFETTARRDRSDFAKEFFAAMAAKIAAQGPPALGIHLMMGETAGLKIENYVKNLHAGRNAPVELILKAV